MSGVREMTIPYAAPRIAFLDGLRGLAIVMVLLYHAYVRWPAVVPFGDAFVDVSLFSWGWLGVQLFFLVSGFVILITLENCLGLKEFLYRRWLRLFPAMLIATLFIYTTAGLFPERPAGQPALSSVLPGLTFIDIKWYQLLFGMPESPLEGAFWSLYVEWKFYVIAGVVYFWRGRNALIAVLISAHLVSVFSMAAAELFPHRYTVSVVKGCSALGLTHFGWFAAGATFWLFYKYRDWRWFGGALLLLLSSAAFLRKLDFTVTLPAVLVGLAFASALLIRPLQQLLCSRVLLFLGAISYPLYLIHENLLVALIVKAGQAMQWVPPVALPILPTGAVILLAWLVARYGEPPLKAAIARRLPL